MAHNLMIEKGKASMMYTGETPWHKLGTKLSSPASSAEAIKAAGLDWKVTKKRLFAIDGGDILKTDKFAVVRQDLWGKQDCKTLGVVSDAYTPVQNVDAFSFFDNIVGKGEAIYHTAGALGDGERIWILAKLPNDIVVKGDDVLNKFLLMANGHDGTLSVQIKFTPIRVVCQNTLTQALNTDSSGLKISHSRNVHNRLADAATTLGIIQTRFDDLEKMFKQMAEKKLNTDKLSEYHQRVFPVPKVIKTKDDEAKTRMMEKMKTESAHYFAEGFGNDMEGIKGTLWAAYNGITEYIDHHREAKNGVDKLNYIWFGGGHAIKAKAYNEALLLLK